MGEIEELGLKPELKLVQVPLFKCSEAVLEGFEAEKTESHKQNHVAGDGGGIMTGLLPMRGA